MISEQCENLRNFKYKSAVETKIYIIPVENLVYGCSQDLSAELVDEKELVDKNDKLFGLWDFLLDLGPCRE